MMLIMTKTARNSRTTSVMWFLVGPVGCTVARTVVGDAEKRVRVKPLSRLQSKLMPPHPHDSGTPTMQTVYTRQLEAPETDPQARWWGERSRPHGALTANGGARFPTQPLSPAVTSEMVT